MNPGALSSPSLSEKEEGLQGTRHFSLFSEENYFSAKIIMPATTQSAVESCFSKCNQNKSIFPLFFLFGKVENWNRNETLNKLIKSLAEEDLLRAGAIIEFHCWSELRMSPWRGEI